MIRHVPLTLSILLAGAAWPVLAQTINLDQAISMTLHADPSIKEKQELVESARALLDEVKGHEGVMIDANLFEGLAPAVHGGFFQGGAYSGSSPRTDGPLPDGLSDWTSLQFAVIKPLYTFGKIEAYSEAAEGNIDVKKADVRLRQAEMIKKVKKAWFAYLTSRDLDRLLLDVQAHLNDAISLVKRNLDANNGQSRQTDLYALQAAQGMLDKYIDQAQAVEKISMEGLKILTGVGMNGDLDVADEDLEPVPLPEGTLDDYKNRALSDRPEMAQVEAGMRARRALIQAHKAEMYPNLYAGVIGEANYASNRSMLNNPFIYDPFNNVGVTPVVGLQWSLEPGVINAQQAQQQAEFDALTFKAQYAQAGIPFEVSEAWNKLHADYDSQRALAQGSAAARRWMIASLADFNAGLEKADKVAEALKTYALTQAEYLQTVDNYNMDVADLAEVTGAPR